MDKTTFKISLDFEGKNELNDIVSKLMQKYKIDANADFTHIRATIENDVEKPMGKVQKMYNSFKTSFADFGFVYSGVTSAVKAIGDIYNATIKATVDAAAETQQLKLRLVSLYQSTEKAEQAFAKFRDVAASTPFSLKQVVEAGSSLKAFGLDAESTLESISDLAAYMGIDIVEAAQAVGRAFAGGVGAADVLRERGVLELIKSFKGIDDLTKLSLPQFREAMLSTFGDASSGIAGASDRMSKSYTGAVSNMQDALDTLKSKIGDNFTPIMGKAASTISRLANSLSGTKTGLDAVKESIIGQRVEFERLVLSYTNLHGKQNRSTIENEKYKNAINDLMTKYPNYLGKIDLERDSWNRISQAISGARAQLQNYINQKIQEAILKDNEDRIIDVSVAKVEAETELEQLEAQFRAGTSERIRTIRTAPNPLSGSPNPGTTTGFSREGERAFQLGRRIESLSREEARLRAELQRKLQTARDIYAIPPLDPEEPGNSGIGAGDSSGSEDRLSEVRTRIEEYQRLVRAGFDLQEAEILSIQDQWEQDVRLFAENSEERRILTEKKESDIQNVRDRYREMAVNGEAERYEQVKFMDSSYYEWRAGLVRREAESLFTDSDERDRWIADKLALLDKEKAAWDNRPVIEFEASYDAEMSHLSELRELGLATYGEIAAKSWEYYRALQAIVSADGEVSEAERELLNIYLARAQAAQLQANSNSDIANYYNEMMFADESYYEWKRARIIKDVSDMDLAEDQKAALLKKRLGELDDELHTDNQDRSLISYMLGDMGFDESDQKGIIESYSLLADQISGIWQQLYSNIDNAKQKSLEKLERRAKEERRSEAWLASEKEKINAEYDKKARQMKRAEKSMQIASASMNTAEGVTNALTLKPAWLAPIMAAAVGSLGLYQVKLIADQKLAGGGAVKPGFFRGKGTSTSDSNLIAISDQEYIVSARRVRELGLPLLDALNFGDGETVRKALASFNYSLNHSAIIQAPASPNRSGAYSSGGAVVGTLGVRALTQKIVLVCDNREIARAVAKGNKRLLTT